MAEAHAPLMARAIAAAGSGDGWIALPDGLAPDFRSPAELPLEPFGEAGRDRPALASLTAQVARRPGAEAYADPTGALAFGAITAAWRG